MTGTQSPSPARVRRRVHPVDQVPPPPKLITYGFQHVAAFYAGAVIVPLIIGGVLGVSADDMIKLIQADLLTCGIASLLQAVGFRIGRFRVGVQLPLLQGVAFAGVAPIITIGFDHGGGSGSLPFIFGAVVVAGILFFLVAPLIAKAVRFFPPVVTGSVLTIIGITLMPVAANHAIGGQLGLPGFDWSYDVMGASQGGHGDPTSPTNFAFAIGTMVFILLGGAALVLFAAVAVVGIQTLGTVNFNDHRNLIVAGTSIAMGVYVMAFPGVTDAVPAWLQWYFSGGIAAGAFTAILLNILFFHLGGHGPAVTTDARGDRIHLDEINQMSREEFGRAFHPVVQGAEWALDAAYALRPFASPMALGEAFQDALLTASTEQQEALLLSFPDLGAEETDGTPLAAEHGARALGNLQEDEHNEIVEMAMAYRERFGYPLIISARDHDRYDQLLRSGWTRMDNSPTTERQAALIEVSKIVNYRYEQLVADANPISSARFGRFSELPS